MKSKIIVYEPNMNGGAHSEVNAGLLEIIEKLFVLENTLIFIGDQEHIRAVEEKKNLDSYIKENVKNFDYSPIFFIINDILLVFRLINNVLFRKKVSYVFLFGIMPFSHIFLSLFNSFFKKKIIIVLHGQMEALLPNTKIGNSKYYYLLSKFVFKRADYIRYIVFGESIKNNLSHLFIDKNKMLVVDQPYFYDNLQIKKNTEKRKLVFGVIGRADSGKNIKAFFNLVMKLQNEIKSGYIEFKIIGKLFENVPNGSKGLFSYYRERVDEETMKREISKLDFALSFTDKNYYRAIPSGVVFDCIKWEVPILGLKNDFIEYYFDKYGQFGEICDSTDELYLRIKEMVSGKKIEKKDFSLVFQRIKEELSLPKIKEKMEKQL